MRSSLLLSSARWSVAVSLLVAVSRPAAAEDWNFTHDASGNPTFGGPFGKIFSTLGTPRLIQFSLKLVF